MVPVLSLFISFDVDWGLLEMFCRQVVVWILLKEVNLSLNMYKGEHKVSAMFKDFIISMLAHVF